MFSKTTDLKKGFYDVLYYELDLELWVWELDGTYYMSEIVGEPIAIDGGTQIYPTDYIYNGKQYYHWGDQWLWYNGSDAWIISDWLGFGTTEYEDGGTWYGDSWWICSTLTGTYLKRGVEKNSGSNKTITAGVIEGRESVTVLGEYTPVTGSAVSGDYWLGWKILADGDEVEYIQDTALHNTYPTFSGTKKIWYDTVLSKWIISNTIGSYDGAVGYWSCSTMIGTYTRTYTGGSTAPSPETHVISHKEYRLLSPVHDNTDTYMGQVVIWL